MTYKTKGELVLEQIQEMIFSGKILPGETVSAIEIAKRLGVSRSPVNEAIKRLSDRGLVKILPSVGFEIRTLPCEEAVDLNEIKYRMEIMAVEQLEGNGGSPDVGPLEEPLSLIARAIKEKSHALYSRAARDFHFELIKLAGSVPLSTIYSIAWDYGGNADSRFLMVNESTDIAVDDHRELVQAIASGEYERAKAILTEHKEKIQSLLRESMNSSC